MGKFPELLSLVGKSKRLCSLVSFSQYFNFIKEEDMFVHLSDLFGCRRYEAVQDELAIATTPRQISAEEAKLREGAQRALPVASASLASSSASCYIADEAQESADKAYDVLKEVEAFGSVLQEGDEQALQEMMKGPWLKKISVDRLREIFFSAAYGGYLAVVLEIVRSNRFKDIPIDGLHGLGDAFVSAAYGGHLAVVLEIERNNRFKEIPADGLHGLGDAFVFAAYKGHLAVVLEIMRSNRFKDIPIDGEYGLGMALQYAVKQNRLEIVQEIMNNDYVFQKIFPEVLMKIRDEIPELKNFIDRYINHLRQTMRVAPVVVFQRALRDHPFRDSILAINGHIIGEYLGI